MRYAISIDVAPFAYLSLPPTPITLDAPILPLYTVFHKYSLYFPINQAKQSK